MFTRSRSGRRGSPARLTVERLEDRFVPHVPVLTTGFSAPALVGPAAVAPAPDASHGRPVVDHSANDVLARLHDARDAGQTGDHGQPADGGHDKGPGEHSTGPDTRQDGREGGSTSGKSGREAPFASVFDRAARPPATDKDSDKSEGKSHGATAKAEPSSSDEDSASDTSSSRRARSEDTSSDDASGRVTSTRAGRSQEATAVSPSTATAPADDGDEGSGSPGASAAGKRAAYLGLVGPVQAAEEAADGGSAPSPVRAAAPTTSTPAVLLRLSDRMAAADGGDANSPEAAPAGTAAASDEAVLAFFDPRPAGPAAPHGQAEFAADGFGVTLPAAVRLERGGRLAEGAVADGESPAAAPAAYAAFAALPAPFAGALLDRLTLDTRALDEALQGFLRGLDRLGEHLTDPRARLGVSAWLLTGAAALAVWELNRRRRAVAAGNVDGVPLSWLDPEGPAPEPAL
jgi:hypothetical protein